jgi:predicted peptidase
MSLAALLALALPVAGGGDGPVAKAATGTAIASGETVLKQPDGQIEATYRYRLVEPPAAAIEGEKRVPLIVFLHGAGERGNDNESQLKHFVRDAASPEFQSAHPCFVLAMQCPAGETWASLRLDNEKKRIVAPTFASEPTRAMRALMQAMGEIIAGRKVDPDCIYLSGLSMGGFGSFDLAARRPKQFAAVIPVCGGGDPATAPLLVDVPIYIVHGDDDPIVPVELSRTMRDAITKAIAAKAETTKPIKNPAVMYREYTKVGHDSWTPAYRFGPDGVLDWLFLQRRTSR